MGRARRLQLAIVVGIGALGFSEGVRAADLYFAAPQRVVLYPGDAESVEVSCYLREGYSVYGWTVVASSSGWEIVGATTRRTIAASFGDEPPGLRTDGFEKTELVMTDEGPAAISTCLLTSGPEPVALPGAQRVLRLELAGPTPVEDGACEAVALFFTEALTEAGVAVGNEVTRWNGETVGVSGRGREMRICRPPSCEASPVSLLVTTEPVRGPLHEVEDPDVGLLTETVHDEVTVEVPTFRGEPHETTLYANISSRFSRGSPPVYDDGVQGWSLSASLTGDLELADVTLDDTRVGYVLEHGGIGFFFWTLEKVDPELVRLESGQPQGEGVVVAVVLPMPYMFPTGTATVLGLTVSSGGHPDAEGQLVWRDGLTGAGQPVENTVTAEGSQHLFCARQPATVRFVEGPPSFLRGDANADGRLDVADPISVLVELFHGGRPSPCAAAADATGDQRVDVSDPIRIFGFLFLGDPPPPAPFPECGPGEDDPGLPCPRGSHPLCP